MKLYYRKSKSRRNSSHRSWICRNRNNEKYFQILFLQILPESMENDLEKIEICKGNSFLIIEHAVDNLIEWLTRFKEKEVNLGHKITDRSDITLTNEMTAGTCPLCQKEIKSDNISHIKEEIRGLF